MKNWPNTCALVACNLLAKEKLLFWWAGQGSQTARGTTCDGDADIYSALAASK